MKSDDAGILHFARGMAGRGGGQERVPGTAIGGPRSARRGPVARGVPEGRRGHGPPYEERARPLDAAGP